MKFNRIQDVTPYKIDVFVLLHKHNTTSIKKNNLAQKFKRGDLKILRTAIIPALSNLLTRNISLSRSF